MLSRRAEGGKSITDGAIFADLNSGDILQDRSWDEGESHVCCQKLRSVDRDRSPTGTTLGGFRACDGAGRGVRRGKTAERIFPQPIVKLPLGYGIKRLGLAVHHGVCGRPDQLPGAESQRAKWFQLSGAELQRAKSIQLSGAEPQRAKSIQLSGAELQRAKSFQLSGAELQRPKSSQFSGAESRRDKSSHLSGAESQRAKWSQLPRAHC